MRFRITAALAAAIATTTIFATPAKADPYLGQILEVGFNFCPRGTTRADGQLLPIGSYAALYSLYGNTYGGDGTTSFGLPNLNEDPKGNPKNWGDVTLKCVVIQGIFPSRT